MIITNDYLMISVPLKPLVFSSFQFLLIRAAAPGVRREDRSLAMLLGRKAPGQSLNSTWGLSN